MTASRYVGARVLRVEDRRLLTGSSSYVDDLALPGMLHARFVRSPVAHATIRGIATAPALGSPGVRFVFTAEDLNPDMHEQWHTSIGRQSPETPRPPLASGKVRFAGDPVALVVADSRAAAVDAAELVEVDYEPLPAVVDYTTAEHADELVHDEHGSNVIFEIPGLPLAALSEAFDGAAHVVRETVRQQACVPAPMEGRGLVVHFHPGTGELTVYASTQAPHEVRLFGSRLTGLPEHLIRVVARDTGGGFGQKVLVQREEMCILLAARKVGAPLKWVEDRSENLLAAGKSRQEHGDVAMAFDAGGRIQATHIDFVQDCGAYPSPWPTNAIAVGMLFPGPYRVPQAGFNVKTVYTNTVGRAAYRGPWMFETLAREVVLDITARRIGIDPIELRRRNLLGHADLPFPNPNGMTYDRISPLETLEQALSILDYDGFRRDQAAALARGRYLGVGTSTYVEPSTPGYGSYGTEGATIRIEPSGKINVFVSGGSAGNSIETTVTQLVADALGADLDDVHTIQGDTALAPFGAGTAGSRSGSMTAGAVAATAQVLADRVRSIAAHRLEAAVEDIELAGSRATVRGTPAMGVSLAEVAEVAYFQPQALPPGLPAGLEATERYTSTEAVIWVNATHVCTCEVDIETGRVRLLRYIVSEDCGPMINPHIVEGQIAGGVVQGIGGALFEHLAYDPEGNPLATTFLDYLVPSAAEVPPIEFGHIETPSPGPGGFKGVGEGGAIGAPAAVVNAVADALSPFGVTITQLPLTPARVRSLITR